MHFNAQCVLFDLDGTLVDTAPDLGRAANAVRAEQGLPPLSQWRYRPYASSGARGLLRIALNKRHDAPDFPPLRDRFLQLYHDQIAEESTLFPGMDDVLRNFEQFGRRWGVVTNKAGWLTRPLMNALKLTDRCACIVSGDDAPSPKPAPDTLLLACAQLGVKPSDCVYVGDDHRDVVAARAAGMPVIAAIWGYLGDQPHPEGWGADALAMEPSELANLIR
jgi:2-phosphoglycolate phosphatase